MFNPIEYVGRLNRRMRQNIIRARQEEELRKYLESPHIYPEGYFLSFVESYDPDSDKCKICKRYLICDMEVREWKAGRIGEIEIGIEIEPIIFSKN